MPSKPGRASARPQVAARLLMACQHRRFALVNALDALRQATVVNPQLLDRSFASAARLAAANRVIVRYWTQAAPSDEFQGQGKPRRGQR